MNALDVTDLEKAIREFHIAVVEFSQAVDRYLEPHATDDGFEYPHLDPPELNELSGKKEIDFDHPF